MKSSQTLYTLSKFRIDSHIGRKWITEGDHGKFEVFNPSTSQSLGSLPNMGVDDTHKAINSAKQSFQSWKRTTCKERFDILKSWFTLMKQNREELAKIISLESGKVITESLTEADYSTSFIEWFAEECKRVYGDVIPSSRPGVRPLCIRQPIGVAALITPWNFPLAMFTRKAAAALAAGCTVVSKPAEDTPYSTLAAVTLAEKAGVPAGVLNVVTCSTQRAPEVGNVLCQSLNVRVLSFTGSSEVGKILIKQSADTVKRLCLELGGNAPFIVFESANLAKAASAFRETKFRFCGQTCVCTNYVLVHRSVYKEFVSCVLKEIAKLKVGDAFEEGVTQGPLINTSAAIKVHSIVQDSIAKGATPIIGGSRHEKGENFYNLTLLENVTADMKCVTDEIFGPVAGFIQFDTEEEALRIANHAQVGLASYFFSEDVSQIYRVSEQLEFGIVAVNSGVFSGYETIFGGWKQSGHGSEGGKYGIDEYLERKYVALGGLEL